MFQFAFRKPSEKLQIAFEVLESYRNIFRDMFGNVRKSPEHFQKFRSCGDKNFTHLTQKKLAGISIIIANSVGQEIKKTKEKGRRRKIDLYKQYKEMNYSYYNTMLQNYKLIAYMYSLSAYHSDLHV